MAGILGTRLRGRQLELVDGHELADLACTARRSVAELETGRRARTETALIGGVKFGRSQRQREIVRLLQRGLSRREIADQLGICPSTLRAHLFQLLHRKSPKS